MCVCESRTDTEQQVTTQISLPTLPPTELPHLVTGIGVQVHILLQIEAHTFLIPLRH